MMLTHDDLVKPPLGPFRPGEQARARVTSTHPWVMALIARLEAIEDTPPIPAATDSKKMKLAKIIKRTDIPWELEDGTLVNPPVGTVVQYVWDLEGDCYVIYFPGYTSWCYIIRGYIVNEYFKDLTDETREAN